MGALVEPRKPAWVGNAPAALSPLVGRQRESSAVRELLLRPSVRLVLRIGERPAYMEAGVLDRLMTKLHDEHGDPPPPPPEKPPDKAKPKAPKS